jgi:ATP-dependent Clp protease ATP-binding subunit ClpB
MAGSLKCCEQEDLNMNFNNFTIKAQEAVQKAQEIAQAYQNPTIDNTHLLKGIMTVDENVVPYLLKKLNVNTEMVGKALDKMIGSLPKVTGGELFLSGEASSALQKANNIAKGMNDEFVSIEHVLLGILESRDQAARLLKDNGVTEKDLTAAIRQLRQGGNVKSQTAEETYNALNKYARNLNDLARSGKLDPVIGRDEEIRRILQILSRRTKNNPILIGEPGVGKTAIAEGLAHRIIDGDVPENLKTKQIYSLDMGSLIAGAKYKGEFEERLKSVVKEVIGSSGEIVLFIDEIHTLVGAGASEGAMDAANILKPALARGDLRAIGATTLKEYQKYFEKDKALERRFQPVVVNEPDTLDAIAILRGLKERYESHHHVRIKDEAIIAAVELSQRYITERFLPDKAIDLIDEAASKLRLEINSLPEDLEKIERRIRQMEIEREAIKRENDLSRLQALSEEIANLQDEQKSLKAKWQAEKELAEHIQILRNDIESMKLEAEQANRNGDLGRVAEIRYGRIPQAEKEIESLKTKLSEIQKDSPMVNEEVGAEEIAEIVSRWTGIPVSRMLQSERQKLLNLETELHMRVVGQEEAIGAISDAIRRSRAGLQDNKRPIGSFIFLGTTGVGKTELAKALAEFLFNNENSMVRIDMSEYQERHTVSRLIGAPPGYVGYEESGQLTEAVRRKPYSVVLLDEIEKAHPDVFNILLQVLDDGRLTDNKGRTVDFKNTIIIMTSNIGSQIIQENMDKVNDLNRGKQLNKIREQVFELLKKSIRPEFLNRVDEIIMFEPLTKDEITRVVELQLATVQQMLAKNDISLTTTKQAINLISALGFDPHYGARPIKRVLQKLVLNTLSKMILEGKVDKDSDIVMDEKEGALTFTNRQPAENKTH